MTKKINYFLVLFLLSAGAASAQTGNISGTVKTSDGSPADLVTVSIKGTSKATYSNESGAYQIKNVKPGAYTLVATFIGLEKKELPVTVIANAITTLDFVLKENSSQLQEVIVSTKRNKNNTIVAKMPLKDLENPQVYNSVPVEILKQQNITTYDDALRNVPGISRTWESTGRAGDGGAFF
jgi:iron complex outermembrane receptor protein